MKGKYIDLHVHTNFSDGFDTIEQVIQKAKNNDVGYISLVEHYNVSSYEIARKIAEDDLFVIPGIEIGADMSDYGKGKHICHILAYFISDDITKILDEYEMDRYNCVCQTLELLKKQGINIKLEEVIENARDKKSIGRFDIAITLAKLGYAKNPQIAYGKYLDHNGASYVKRNKLKPEELIEKIIDCGGVPVLAHPKSLRLEEHEAKRFIKKLIDAGLCGIEVFNPNNTSANRQFYSEICYQYNLVRTCGSDYHGGNRKPKIEIGLGIDNNLMKDDVGIIEELLKKKKKIDKYNNKRNASNNEKRKDIKKRERASTKGKEKGKTKGKNKSKRK